MRELRHDGTTSDCVETLLRQMIAEHDRLEGEWRETPLRSATDEQVDDVINGCLIELRDPGLPVIGERAQWITRATNRGIIAALLWVAGDDRCRADYKGMMRIESLRNKGHRLHNESEGDEAKRGDRNTG